MSILTSLKDKIGLFTDKTFMKFVMVGVINTIVGTTIMFVFYNVFHLNYWVSSASNYFFGSIVSYLLNKNFTFRFHEKGYHSLYRFITNILTCYLLAQTSLRRESMKVYRELKEGTIDSARKAVSMIVGRDTQVLDEKGVTKAAVETVAENFSDGVFAPMMYAAIGGPVLGLTYKAINTMDSMIGYKNDRYMWFGTAAAKLDDVVNYIPSRISALLLVAASAVSGKSYDAGRAFRIWKRDRANHKSPNAAQTESAAAGALGLQLAGDAQYFGRIVRKPFIGDKVREIEAEDIVRVNRLMTAASFIGFILCTLGICLASIIAS